MQNQQTRHRIKIAQRTCFTRRQCLSTLFALAILAPGVWASNAFAGQPAEPGARQSIRVACVGDSITYGAGIKDRKRDSYPSVLGRLLGSGYDVRNFGVNGATLLNKGDRPYARQKAHAEALAFAPDIVVIMLGTNDSKHRDDGSLDSDHTVNNWQYQADYVPDYESLIAEFRRANSKAKVFVCLPTPCFPGRWGINNKTIHDEIIPLVRQVAKDTGARVIDLNTPLAGRKNLFPDTVHPNAAGASLMAATVYQAKTGKEASPRSP